MIQFQPVQVAGWSVAVERRMDGSIFVEPQLPLGPYPDRITDRLDLWAREVPDRTFLAERDSSGEWRRIGYEEFRRQARAAARWLLEAGLSAERPVAILSGNDIEHAILAVGSMYAGIPYAPVSPAYSLLSSDLGRLRHVFELLTPGLVFASDGGLFARAIDAVVPYQVPLVVTRNSPPCRPCLEFPEITAGTSDEALPPVHTDSVAKVLFTSGSANLPKGVITTHRMLAANQEMLRTVFPFFAEEPPTICDWLPWNHTFGGSHNFGIVLYNGGTMYLDAGRPLEGGFDPTVANLREIAPTVYFNVPKGFEMLVPHLRADAALRERFFSCLQMMFYAGAGLSQHVWNQLETLAVETRGQRIPMLTGLGATETAPFAMCASAENRTAGVVGLPVPGVRLKLAPVDGKLEARVQGPNVTPGYWREPELTLAAFDDEAFYRTGDGLRFLDPADANRGFLFDGRLSEDFKLSTGTWVSVGPLRTHFLLHAAPFVKDVVIAGHDRDDVTALIFPASSGEAHTKFETLLSTFAALSRGSSMRIERAIVLDEPPSLDHGEWTEKGTVNQGAVLRRRAALVERLYQEPYAADVICARIAGPVRAPQAEAPSQIERVVVTLREKVLRGEFRPGERLAELTLVPQLNASRTPVRLALERLSHQGLLEPLASGGFRVREFTVADIWDAIELRGVLEGTAARLAAERFSDRAELTPLRRCHEAFAEAAPMEMEDFLDYVGKNMDYHRELWKLAKSPTLERALEGVCALPFAEPGALVFGGADGAGQYHARNAAIAIEHHRAILEAIEHREGARAESLAREHSRLARNNLDWAMQNRELLRQFPGASLIALPGGAAGKRIRRRRKS